jgi:hypothetical protein
MESYLIGSEVPIQPHKHLLELFLPQSIQNNVNNIYFAWIREFFLIFDWLQCMYAEFQRWGKNTSNQGFFWLSNA